MKTALFIILTVTSLCAIAADDWTTEDTYREAAYLAVDAVDWAQTRNIARNPDKWHEQNGVLGEHPTVSQVDNYFISMAVAHVVIAHVLPADYRSAFQYITLGAEISCVGHNIVIGISAKF